MWKRRRGNGGSHRGFLSAAALLSHRSLVCPPLQCSASCGPGYRQRLVSCSEVHVENENYEYSHQSLSSCPGTPPDSYMPCDLEPCPPPLEWRVGIWGPVSASLKTFSRQLFIQYRRLPNKWSSDSEHREPLVFSGQSDAINPALNIY